ncbi:ImmA/IrrE family metallo-endopeptidase [Methanobrevibacter sp.]|uniref:ImmA/IrrE family metallo-endopeptidase n=1 Tax=Methanobrevibacter sp. TaxID=66852 RepID=UPI00388FF84D
MPDALHVNPAMIKWAREDAGYSLEELPDYLEDAEKWETGEKTPSWADLRKLAKKYKRPSFFYFLSEPPKKEKDLIEFRADEKIEEYSPNLRLEIRKAKFRRNAFLHIYEDMGVKVPTFNQYVLTSRNVHELATHIRNYLNVDFEIQKGWFIKDNGNKSYDHINFLNHWKEICFELGILVFELENVSESEVSGCSIYYDTCPIILLNGKNTPNRRIFTLMHELAHLTQGTSAICDVDKHNRKEIFCNKVASEVLIPHDTLDKEVLFYKNGNLNLSNASNMYGVSKQTMVYKLNSLNIISDDLKEEFISQLEEKNRLDKIKKEERNKDKEYYPMPVERKKKKFDGEPYARLVLQAFENNVITAPKAVKYLDAPIDKFELISNEIWG